MNVKIQKKLLNFLTLKYIFDYNRTLKRAEKKPAYWIKQQNKNIKTYINYIYQIPFYRKKFDELKLKPSDIKTAKDFHLLPQLTKEEYRQWIKEETMDSQEYQYWIKKTTSGSSGSPLTLYSLPKDLASDIANLFRATQLQDKGYNIFFDKIFSMMVHDSSTKSFVQKLGILRRKQESSIHPPQYLVEKFNEYKPDFFYGNKTAMQLMAHYALEHHIEMHHPKCLGSISEALDDNSRKTIEQAFGENLFDIYGTAELGNFAIEKCGKPLEHKIWHDTHIVNVIDEEGNIIDNGIGQIIVTPIKHFGFPLLNYKVGDYVETYTRDGIRYISQIIGRTNDKIKNLDGSVYSWMHMSRLMAGLIDIAQYRFVQESYEVLKLQLVMEKGSKKSKEDIEKIIIARSQEIFNQEMKIIAFEWKDVLSLDSHGKLRVLVSKI